MSVPSIQRVIRTVMQSGLAAALIEVLVAFGVPITSDQRTAVLAFVAALAAVALSWNAVEDATGKSVLKQG